MPERIVSGRNPYSIGFLHNPYVLIELGILLVYSIYSILAFAYHALVDSGKLKNAFDMLGSSVFSLFITHL